jgi:hypothetical protein
VRLAFFLRLTFPRRNDLDQLSKAERFDRNAIEVDAGKCVTCAYVRFGSKADICAAKRHVRFKATEIADIMGFR